MDHDSSTDEPTERSDEMHPTILQQLAQLKIEAFDREAEAASLVAIVRQAADRPADGPTRRGRPGWLRAALHVRGAGA